MVKDKHQANKVFVVVNGKNIILCTFENQQKQNGGKETLGNFNEITTSEEICYVVATNLGSTNARKKPEYKFVDSDGNELRGYRCDGTADVVLGVDVIYTKDASVVCKNYATKLAESVNENA